MSSRTVFYPKLLIFSAIFMFSLMYGFVITHPGQGTSFQSWGVYHYYINAKYFDELGYDKLYSCTAKAMQDSDEFVRANRFVRNLQTYDLDPYQNSIEGCDISVFPPKVWDSFQKDVKYIVGLRSETYWLGVMKDKGFNASPLWLVIGEPLAKIIPIDSLYAKMAMQIDWVLLVMMCVLAGIYFSPRVGAVFALFLMFFFGTHGRLVGNYFQFLWLVSAVLGLVAWQANKTRLSAVAFSVAGLLRLFPILFILGIAIKIASKWVTQSENIEFQKNNLFLKWYVLSSFLVFLLSALTNPSAWIQFSWKILIHAQFIINEPFHMGFSSFSRAYLSTGGGELISFLLVITAIAMYLIAILRSSSLVSFGISTILMYFLLTSSPYYMIAVGLLILATAKSELNTQRLIGAMFICWIAGVFLTTPLAFRDLRAIAFLLPEVFTLIFYLGVLIIFAREELKRLVMNIMSK